MTQSSTAGADFGDAPRKTVSFRVYGNTGYNWFGLSA